VCWHALRASRLLLLAKNGLSGFAGWTGLGFFLAAVVAARVSADSVSRFPANAINGADTPGGHERDRQP
jgi:hypothetical protein